MSQFPDLHFLCECKNFALPAILLHLSIAILMMLYDFQLILLWFRAFFLVMIFGFLNIKPHYQKQQTYLTNLILVFDAICYNSFCFFVILFLILFTQRRRKNDIVKMIEKNWGKAIIRFRDFNLI